MSSDEAMKILNEQPSRKRVFPKTEKKAQVQEKAPKKVSGNFATMIMIVACIGLATGLMIWETRVLAKQHEKFETENFEVVMKETVKNFEKIEHQLRQNFVKIESQISNMEKECISQADSFTRENAKFLENLDNDIKNIITELTTMQLMFSEDLNDLIEKNDVFESLFETELSEFKIDAKRNADKLLVQVYELNKPLMALEHNMDKLKSEISAQKTEQETLMAKQRLIRKIANEPSTNLLE